LKNEIPRVKFSLLILILSLRLNLRKQLSSRKSGQSSLKFYPFWVRLYILLENIANYWKLQKSINVNYLLNLSILANYQLIKDSSLSILSNSEFKGLINSPERKNLSLSIKRLEKKGLFYYIRGTLVSRLHSRLIHSGFSHVFVSILNQ